MNKTKLLPFCINKTKFPKDNRLLIHESSSNTDVCPNTCNSIEIVSHWKYLGLDIDCYLRWDHHILALTKRLRRYIYPFLTLRNFMPISLLKEVYYALIQSAIEYGISTYGRSDPTNIVKLQ